MDFMSPIVALPLIVLGFFLITSSIKIISEYDRAVVFRLGRFYRVKGPGLIILVPILDKMIKVGMRTVAMDVPPQDVITKDNVSIKVNAVIYFRVVDPERAVIQVEDFLYATSQLGQTTLRSILGESELDEILSQREKLNAQLQSVLDKHTDAWGIKISLVEVKQVDLPVEMQRAMAKQAEAERLRRAKVISAEGEFQASTKLSEAAGVIEKHPTAMQLRFMQTLVEIAADKNSTIVFPVPVDLISMLIDKMKK